MARTIGILLFDGAEEMDFTGPWEVFTAAVSGMPSHRVITIAERRQPIICEMGMRVIPDKCATRRDVGQQPAERPIHRRAGEPAIIITLRPAHPTFVSLARRSRA